MRLVSSNLINWLNFNLACLRNQIKVNTLTERNTKRSKDDLFWQRIHLTKNLLILCSVSKAADEFSSSATRCLSCSRGGDVCQRCVICNACMPVHTHSCSCRYVCVQSLFLHFSACMWICVSVWGACAVVHHTLPFPTDRNWDLNFVGSLVKAVHALSLRAVSSVLPPLCSNRNVPPKTHPLSCYVLWLALCMSLSTLKTLKTVFG